ncbi:hypothetical protein BJF78_05560 [Pseudonocardia sp. CNS-139]|nr:hypothetical protein BJF78_05560 [Pseudonocardia sp. CNS-139]
MAALTGTGVLARSAPPMVSRPVTDGLWPGLRTAEKAQPRRVEPVLLGERAPEPAPDPVDEPPDEPVVPAPARPADDLDDEALEELLLDPPPVHCGAERWLPHEARSGWRWPPSPGCW